MTRKSYLLYLLFFAYTFTVSAHGDLTKRINHKTSEIKLSPNNAELYFERGFLYQQHEEYDKATLDYIKAEKLGYINKLLDFRKAETYYKWDKFDLALKSSLECLQKDKTDVKINKLHGQILFKLEQFEEAINYYTYFINTVQDSRPEDYIEFSEMTLKAYKDYNKSIIILDNGIERLGDIVSLQLQKLEYFKISNQTEKVIEQYNHFILTNKRKEFWYFKKANYLFDNNQIVQSKIALQQAKASIAILKDKIKNTQAIKTLITNINNLEKQINHE